MTVSNHVISDAIIAACRASVELNQLVSKATSGKKIFYHIGLNLDDHGRYDTELYNPDIDSRIFTREQQTDYRAPLLIDTIGRTDNSNSNKYQIGLQLTLAHDKEYTSENTHTEVGTDYIRYVGINEVEDMCIEVSKIIKGLSINGVSIQDVDYETQPLKNVSNLSIYKGYILCEFLTRKGFC